MAKGDGQSSNPEAVDWPKVEASLVEAAKQLAKAEAKLFAARDLVKEAKDRNGGKIQLLGEELSDVASRFDSLKRTLESQSGPEIEAQDEDGDASSKADGDG